MWFNPLTAGPDFIIFFFFLLAHLSMLKIKRDINQQYLKIVRLNFVSFE